MRERIHHGQTITVDHLQITVEIPDGQGRRAVLDIEQLPVRIDRSPKSSNNSNEPAK